MSTKQIGNIGEAHTLTKLVDYGFPVYIQWGDNESADLLVLVDNKPIKLQVKSSARFNGDKTIFDLVTASTRVNPKHKYTTEEVDAFVCYDIAKDKCYLVRNTGDITKFTVRYTLPRNGCVSDMNYFAEYEMTEDKLRQMVI